LTAGQREALWADLAGEDAGRALAAAARLADAPDEAVAQLRQRLRPASPPPADDLRQALTDLDAGDFDRREAATRRLADWGDVVHPALRAALQDKPSPEAKRRLEGLLADPWRVRAPEPRRRLRAVRLLEGLDTPGARQVLEALAGGDPRARLTQEAKAALERLARRPASP
jgi:hypothetical protein